MRSVLFAPTASYPHPLYSMYWNVAKTDANHTSQRLHAIRYDITPIPPANPRGENVRWVLSPQQSAGKGDPERTLLYYLVLDDGLKMIGYNEDHP